MEMFRKTSTVVMLLIYVIFLQGAVMAAGPKIFVSVQDETAKGDNRGKELVQQIKENLKKAGKFDITTTGVPRIIIQVKTLRVPELPYTSIFSVTWMAQTNIGEGPIFLDHDLGLISEAHLGKDAEDIVAEAGKLAQEFLSK